MTDLYDVEEALDQILEYLNITNVGIIGKELEQNILNVRNIVKNLTIPDVVGRSEQLVCYKKCGKTEPYNDICLNCGSSINYDAN